MQAFAILCKYCRSNLYRTYPMTSPLSLGSGLSQDTNGRANAKYLRTRVTEEKARQKAIAEMRMIYSISNLCTQRFRSEWMLVVAGRISAGASGAGKRLIIRRWGRRVHMMTVVTSVTSRTFQHARSHVFNVYLHFSTFSQENEPIRNGGHVGVSFNVLPPPPLDLRSVAGGKAPGHTTSKEGEKALASDDPLSEYYAQARADYEAQVSRFIGYPNSLVTYLRLVESRRVRFR